MTRCPGLYSQPILNNVKEKRERVCVCVCVKLVREEYISKNWQQRKCHDGLTSTEAQRSKTDCLQQSVRTLECGSHSSRPFLDLDSMTPMWSGETHPVSKLSCWTFWGASGMLARKVFSEEGRAWQPQLWQSLPLF